jgi:hypothetical protein
VITGRGATFLWAATRPRVRADTHDPRLAPPLLPPVDLAPLAVHHHPLRARIALVVSPPRPFRRRRGIVSPSLVKGVLYPRVGQEAGGIHDPHDGDGAGGVGGREVRGLFQGEDQPAAHGNCTYCTTIIQCFFSRIPSYVPACLVCSWTAAYDLQSEYKAASRAKSHAQVCAVFTIQWWCGDPLIAYAITFYEEAGLDAIKAFDLNLGVTSMYIVGTLISWPRVCSDTSIRSSQPSMVHGPWSMVHCPVVSWSRRPMVQELAEPR